MFHMDLNVQKVYIKDFASCLKYVWAGVSMLQEEVCMLQGLGEEVNDRSNIQGDIRKFMD